MDEQSSSSDKPADETQNVRPEVSNDDSVDRSGAQHAMPVSSHDSHPSAPVLDNDTSTHADDASASAHAIAFGGSWITPSSDDYTSDFDVDSIIARSHHEKFEPGKSPYTHSTTPERSYRSQARSHTDDESVLKPKAKLDFGSGIDREMIDNAMAFLGIPQKADGRYLRKDRDHKRWRYACETCRERRVKCDEARPICKTCERSKRHCEGYGSKQRGMSSGQSIHSFVEHNDRERSRASPHRVRTIKDDVLQAFAMLDLCLSHMRICSDSLPQGEWRDETARMKLLTQDLRTISVNAFFGKNSNAQRIMKGFNDDIDDLFLLLVPGRWSLIFIGNK